jgi:hypothetical protein
MQESAETSASSISLGSCQEFYNDLPDQFHLDLLGESSTSFISGSTSTATTESDDNDKDHSRREVKFAAPMSMSMPMPSLPLAGMDMTKPKPFNELEHSTLTPLTLATAVTVSSSSLVLQGDEKYNKLPVLPFIASQSQSSPPSCPPEQLRVQTQAVVTAPVSIPLEVEDTDCSQCRIKGKYFYVSTYVCAYILLRRSLL